MSIEVASIVTVTRESVTFSRVSMVSSKRANRPRTLLTIRCRTVNPTSECTGSMSQFPMAYPGTAWSVEGISAPGVRGVQFRKTWIAVPVG